MPRLRLCRNEQPVVHPSSQTDAVNEALRLAQEVVDQYWKGTGYRYRLLVNVSRKMSKPEEAA